MRYIPAGCTPVEIFLHERCKLVRGAQIRRRALFRAFTSFYADGDIAYGYTPERFGREMMRAATQLGVTGGQSKIAGQYVRVYTGIALKLEPAPDRMEGSALPRAVVSAYLGCMTEVGPKEGEGAALVRKEDIHSDFLGWAKRRDWPHNLTLPAFGHHLLALRPSVTPRRLRVEGGAREWFYAGIKLNEY